MTTTIANDHQLCITIEAALGFERAASLLSDNKYMSNFDGAFDARFVGIQIQSALSLAGELWDSVVEYRLAKYSPPLTVKRNRWKFLPWQLDVLHSLPNRDNEIL